MRWQGLLGCVLLIAMLAGCAGDTEEVLDACEEAGDASCVADPCDDGVVADASDALANATANATATAAANSTEGGDCPAGNETAPPVPVLRLLGADGGALNGSILEGESITFSAEGSEAEAGLQAVALVVDEPNGTRTLSLFDNGTFQDASLSLPRAGVVNATLRVLDGAGKSASVSSLAYVDRATSGSESGKLYAPESSGCSATLSVDDAMLVGNMFVHRQSFQVGSNVTWFSVQAESVQAVAICDPAGNRIDTGDSGGFAATDVAEWEPGTQYYVALHPSGPEETMEWTTIVHYGLPPS